MILQKSLCDISLCDIFFFCVWCMYCCWAWSL